MVSQCVRAVRLLKFTGLLGAVAAMILTPALGDAAQPNQATPSPAPVSSAPAVNAAKGPDVSKEAVVFDQLVTKIREESDGTGTRETTARIRVLADAGVKQLAVLTFTYTAANQQIDIAYVRVIKPDGTVVTTPDYNVQDMPADVTREAPMYSDIHQKHVAVKGLGVGDTLEYQTTQRTLKAEAPGQFWLEYTFEKDSVVLNEDLDLDIPADKFVTVSSADLQPEVTTANGRKLYHWASKNLSRPDPDAPPKSIKTWKPSVQVTTFASWQQVGEWYSSLAKGQLTLTPAIQAKADALTKGMTSDDEKIEAIFNSVALHTHYVGLDFGIGRYQPHPADDVLSNEYGDCKDKHTLLAALLKAEGIEAWPVLISTVRELDAATPSPAQFNHVITVVPRGGKLLWMDSTEEVAPVGVLGAGLRDKLALAIPPGEQARLERTPADLPFPQESHFDVAGKIDTTGKFTAHITQSYHGDTEMVMRSLFRAVPEAQWTQFLQRVSSGLGFGGEVTAPEVSPVEKLNEPLKIAYEYTREKYGEWQDRRISPPMPPVGWELMPGVKQIKPADDIDIGSPGEQVYASTMQLPAGWMVFPQAGIDLNESWAEYHSKYSFANGVYTAERRLVFKKEHVPLVDWDKYLAFREAIYADAVGMATVGSPAATPDISHSALRVETPDRSQIQEMLTQIQPLHDAAALLNSESGVSDADKTRAEELCRQAVTGFEVKSQQFAASDAHALFQAEILAQGWTCLGWAELEQNHLDVAEEYLRAAWKTSQTPLAGFELGRLLAQKGAKAEAAHVFELAYVSRSGTLLSLAQTQDVDAKITEHYQKLTGRTMKATPLNPGGQYNGSLRAELDKDIEIHGYVRQTKLSGQAMFAVTYENGKPNKAVLLSGDKSLAILAGTLEGRRFPVMLPAASKARLVREVKLICSPWGGCDAYMLLPSAVQIPMSNNVIEVAPPPSPPKGPGTVPITRLPVN